ncbi:MAG: ImmA/IrrE family metallo-endopeptidase [Acidobacteria bacterium]|nr:ImmA/IrrE family metallo-endopeptidase [Acidobacteriota bacterium]
MCEETNVRVIEADIRSKGEYAIFRDQAFIVVRRGLSGPMRLWVGLHELGHHLLHAPVTHRFSRGTARRMDREANFFAAIAMIPTNLVESSLSEFDVTLPTGLINVRNDILSAFGF